MSPVRSVAVVVCASILAYIINSSAAAQHLTAPTQGIPNGVLLQPRETCPVTKPPVNSFVPPWPYSASPGKESFWFGTDRLWTVLPGDADWSALPHQNGTYRQKLFWFRAVYDSHAEPYPKLRVTGTRLDGLAPPLAADEHANAGWQRQDQPFIVIGINIPTVGCWKITGRYGDGDDQLSYVVWVGQ